MPRSLTAILLLNRSIENWAEEVLFLGLYEKMLVKLDILEMKKTDLFASFFMIFNKRKKEVLWLKQNMTRILKKFGCFISQRENEA